MKDRPQLRVDDSVNATWRKPNVPSSRPSSRDDDIDTNNRNSIDRTGASMIATTKSPDALPLRHKLTKRPRSPHTSTTYTATAAAVASISKPTTLPPLPGAPQLPDAAMRQERQMRSFLQHFLADDNSGRFAQTIDLQQHALDSGVSITDATVAAVVTAVPAVQRLTLSGCAAITDASIWAIARQCTQLHSIDLRQCVRVTELGLRLLAHHCQLVLIDLSDCVQVTDSVLQTLAAGCYTLETVILQRCTRVTDAGIVKLAQCCKALQHVDVSECAHVGEFGDKALVELGRSCPQLTTLDLFGCRHVRDAGVRAVARGCNQLTTLKLTGCRDVSSVAIRALASQCSRLHTLSLAGCIKTTNDDLAALATQCSQLQSLDISGSPSIDAVGVRALAKQCTRLSTLSLADCPRVTDAALQALASSTSQALATLSLANCTRISETGVELLTAACSNLVTLDLTGCDRINRRFLQRLIYKLAFVEWATTFFGFQPLPNAAELCRQRDVRLLQERSAKRIQAAVRGCLARGGLYEAKLRFVERRVLPKIQARIRGFLVRKRIAVTRQQQREDHAARVIGHEYRSLQLRRMLARAKRLRRIRDSEHEAAVIFQKLFRGYQARRVVRQLRDERQRQQHFEARVAAMRELAAVKLQRAYRGHCGRSEAAVRAATREAQKQQQAREQRAVVYLQRVYRGHCGRQQRAQKLAARALLQRRHTGARQLQKVFRGQRGRRNALRVRADAAALQRIHAAMTIQRHWRGVKQKHLAAVLLGLVQLRAREHRAAQSIQAAYRAHASRGFAQTLRRTMVAQRQRIAAATTIQRVLRGHNGRALAEVQRELCKLAAQARPLFTKQTRLEALVAMQRSDVDTLERTLHRDEADEQALTLELDKTMAIKTKYHDSSRMTGTPQRYLTQYLQVQLADQLRAKRLALALHTRNVDELATTLRETEKQLRVVKRALEPLTDGVVSKTRANRTMRLQEQVRRERFAAVTIQRHFRGFRVRCAVREGSNCWIQLSTAAAVDVGTDGQRSLGARTYYYNALTGDTRWSRPLAMDIFNDTFAAPVGALESSAPRADVLATVSKNSSDGAWYEAYDDTVHATYYYHSGTREYQWERPATLSDASSASNSTERESARCRRAWLDDHCPNRRADGTTDDVDALETLLATTIVRGALLGGTWETRIEPVGAFVFYYNPQLRALRTSLSPRTVHASLGDAALKSRRTARSIRYDDRNATASTATASASGRRPVHWQFRYGYEYDSSGTLVASAATRRVWTQHVDAVSGATYYHNALTDEYRWEAPADVDASYEHIATQRSASHDWYEATLQVSDDSGENSISNAEATSSRRATARVITARGIQTRVLGTKWVELQDPATQHTYYYNVQTGETRWSLSPRSARDASTLGEHECSLALWERVMQLRTSSVPYTARAEHMMWLDAAIATRDWRHVDGLVQQMLLREQSATIAASKSTRQYTCDNHNSADNGDSGAGYGTTSDYEAVADAVEEQATMPVTDDAMEALAIETTTPSSDKCADSVAPSAWTAYVDDVGNTFYYNEHTGETSWTIESLDDTTVQQVETSSSSWSDSLY